jgi:hypothetical protein
MGPIESAVKQEEAIMSLKIRKIFDNLIPAN